MADRRRPRSDSRGSQPAYYHNQWYENANPLPPTRSQYHPSLMQGGREQHHGLTSNTRQLPPLYSGTHSGGVQSTQHGGYYPFYSRANGVPDPHIAPGQHPNAYSDPRASGYPGSSQQPRQMQPSRNPYPPQYTVPSQEYGVARDQRPPPIVLPPQDGSMHYSTPSPHTMSVSPSEQYLDYPAAPSRPYPCDLCSLG